MGRAKLRLELMKDEKVRRTTYENRMKGLLKKAEELSTLCGVDLCVILYGPSRKTGAMEMTVWPRNQDKVAGLIDSYRSSRSCDDSGHRSYDLSKFFKEQTEKIEEEIKKLRQKKREVAYPKWDESYNVLSREQLKEFSSILAAKIDAVKARINFINTSASINLSTESGVFLNSLVPENTVFLPKMLDTMFEQPNIIHQLQQQPQPLSYNDAPQFFTENEMRMMMLTTTNNDPSCNNYGYGTYYENPGNYTYDCIQNQIQNCGLGLGNCMYDCILQNHIQNCGLGNPTMEIDSGFIDADLFTSHYAPQNGQGMLLPSSFPSFEWSFPSFEWRN